MNNKLKFDLTGSTTNNPVNSPEIYAAALIKGGSKETFNLIADVKDKARLRKHNFGTLLQADGCTFNDQGAGVLSEKLVEACPLKIGAEICQSTLESSFVANSMRPGSNNADFLPADFQNYLTSELTKKLSAEFETLVWQGDTAGSPADVCDGLLVKFVADSTVVDVTGNTVTSSTVIATLNAVYAAIPETVKFSDDLRLYVSSNVLASYRQAVSAASAEGYYDSKLADSSFLGIPMVLAQGLGSSEIVAAESQNLFLITDLMSDFDDIRILSMLDTTGDDTVRIVGRMKFAVDYAYGAEIVYARP